MLLADALATLGRMDHEARDRQIALVQLAELCEDTLGDPRRASAAWRTVLLEELDLTPDVRTRRRKAHEALVKSYEAEGRWMEQALTLEELAAEMIEPALRAAGRGAVDACGRGVDQQDRRRGARLASVATRDRDLRPVAHGARRLAAAAGAGAGDWTSYEARARGGGGAGHGERAGGDAGAGSPTSSSCARVTSSRRSPRSPR